MYWTANVYFLSIWAYSLEPYFHFGKHFTPSLCTNRGAKLIRKMKLWWIPGLWQIIS